MPLVDAKCTNCGATLEVDSLKDAAICPYCNSAFIVEKAINQYYTQNYINADIVNVYAPSNDFHIRAGRLLEYCGAAIDVQIPDGVVVVAPNAFADLEGLRSVIVPASVKSIESGAFSGCTGLTSVTLQQGLIEIGNDAFLDCLSLTGIVIPDSVVSIGSSAFENCESLRSVQIPASITTIPLDAFSGCENLQLVSYPHLDANHQAFLDAPFYLQRWGVKWQCAFCDHENPPEVKHCKVCGFENIDDNFRIDRKWRCPICHRRNLADSQYCLHCTYEKTDADS